MLGLAQYASDDEEAAEIGDGPSATSGAPPASGLVAPVAPILVVAKAAAPSAPTPPGSTNTAKRKPLPPARLKELRREVRSARSATAVVQVVRQAIDTAWDSRWGAEALYQIAKRSTARTRREWSQDKTVKELAKRLQEEVATNHSLPGAAHRDGEVLDVLVLALEGLRRMSFQEPSAQKEVLEYFIGWLNIENWRRPVKTLARLFWLGAPLKSALGKQQAADFGSHLAEQLRNRAADLAGPDMALIVAAMQHGARDMALLSKVVNKVKAEGLSAGMSATDLVEMAEGFHHLGVTEEGALRPLGQEALRRRGELTPDESHRIHTAYQAMKLPLPQVWMQPGATKKREAAEIVTTQAFATQEGHEKKRRGNHDVERVSPPRVVRDYKMMSY